MVVIGMCPKELLMKLIESKNGFFQFITVPKHATLLFVF